MLRSIGAIPLTRSSPIQTSPLVGSSSPAAIRSTVVFPEPEGPTTTMNSPSAISRSSASTATVPPGKVLQSCLKSIRAMSASSAGRRDPVAVPEGAPLRDPPLGGEVDEDDPEALRVAVLPLEVVQQRPDVVAPDVDAELPRPLDGVDVPAQVGDAAVVLDDVGAVERVVEGGAVLGDHERHVAVVAAQPLEELGQGRRHD